MTLFTHSSHIFNSSHVFNFSRIFPCDPSLDLYITNLTSSYTDQRNEASMVSASVIMFVLAGLFFNLNLFSGGLSDVSAILDPKVRLILSSALSLFLPVMSYLFSEAKNASSSTARAGVTDFSLRAGLILLWMLLVELLRKKVDEIRMRGYSATIQRAGRVVWLGSLVFFNIQSAGRKAVFGVLWILCATKVAQRIAFTEVGKRSYAHGKNARLITSYMAQMLETNQQGNRVGAGDVEQAVQGGHELLKRCKYIVMGEEKLPREATADGYELNEITPDDSIVTVGKVWELAERDRLFTTFDRDQRLRRLSLSFALFKLLRRRFEHLPAMTNEEARNCRDLIFKGLYNNGEGPEGTAEALFQVMNDEVNFLSEYYHSVVPVILASPFFFLANYFLLPIVVFGLCLMTIILCGNGDMRYAFSSIEEDNYILRAGVTKITMCLLSKAKDSPPAFFSIVDLSISFLLFIIFFYEEVWEFLVFLLSNWFMVSLLCNYTAKPHWRESPTFSGAFRRILWLRSKMGHPVLSFKQFSVLNLRWPLILGLPATLSLMVRTVPVPNNVKHSIVEYLVTLTHGHGGADTSPLTNGMGAVGRNNLTHTDLLRACESDSVAELILTWHIATSLLEVKCPPQSKEEAALSRVATSLSNYCAYLVAFHPELLPDNQDKTESVFEAMKEELKGRLGCWEYYTSRRRARVDKIMETTGWREKKVVRNGATIGAMLMEEAQAGLETVWKVLADVWTELIVFVAPSSDEERVKGHENVLVQGGEFVTVLWALTTHAGISRPANSSTLQGGLPES